VKLFPWQADKDFFSKEDNDRIILSIRAAEQRTSGEIRVFVESHCKFVDAIDRAKEIFYQLQMDKTKDRNGTLVYIAVKDRQAAIFGDEGIHEKVGQKYWEDEITKMLMYFNHDSLAEGICQCVDDIGEALHHYFPYERQTDKNELPDDIVFGR
jgi:uncharacterized membrane protein